MYNIIRKTYYRSFSKFNQRKHMKALMSLGLIFLVHIKAYLFPCHTKSLIKLVHRAIINFPCITLNAVSEEYIRTEQVYK